MKQDITYRRANKKHSRFIAEMIALSSDGIASLEWEAEAASQNDVSALDVGSRRYAREDGDYSYRNCLIAESDRPVGMILAFPITELNYSWDAKPPPYSPDQLYAPYEYLEALNSWYICGIAVVPEYRKRGIASKLIELTTEQAVAAGYSNVSLVAMQEKSGLISYYQSKGFRITRSAPIVEHPGIRARGEAVLMETHPRDPDSTPRSEGRDNQSLSGNAAGSRTRESGNSL